MTTEKRVTRKRNDSSGRCPVASVESGDGRVWGIPSPARIPSLHRSPGVNSGPGESAGHLRSVAGANGQALYDTAWEMTPILSLQVSESPA